MAARHRRRRRRLAAVALVLLVTGAGLLTAGILLATSTTPLIEVLPPSRAPYVDLHGRIPIPTSPATGPSTTHDSGTAATPSTTLPAPPLPSLLPGVQVVIPAIGVDAPLVRLGLEPDGTLQVPTSFSEAGWWSGGPFPGDPGPAVIAGHVSSWQGPGVFYRLGELAAGDLVTVVRPSGTKATFRVTSAIEVAKTAFPTNLVYGPVKGRQLRLITCGGPFDSSTGHFIDNLIVFASFVSMTK